MTKYQISCFALKTRMHLPEKWSCIAISTWLWTHPWQHLILNTFFSQRALLDTWLPLKIQVSDIWRWSHCDRSFSSPTHLPSNNFQFIFLTQALLCPEFIFGVCLSARRNGNSTKLWLIDKILSVWILNTVTLKKFCLASASHVSLYSFYKCHCCFLSFFPPFLYFQKYVENMIPLFLVSASNSYIITPRKLMLIVNLLTS